MINKYEIKVLPNIDLDSLDNNDREELEDIIDTEITSAQSSIEYWCEDNNCDYDLFENHRCIVTTKSLYADENIEGAVKCIEDNMLEETYIKIEMMER